MKDKSFVERVRNHFSFLEVNYGFKEGYKKNSETRPQLDGIVKYTSNTTMLLVDSETGQAAVRFIRIQDDERFYLDPVAIHEYLSTDGQEKQILLSRDFKDHDAASAIFNKKYLLSSSAWMSQSDDVYANLERRLKNYSEWLKENANLCLLGDFSRWPEFYEYKINRLIADEIRQGGKDVVLAVVQDEKGVFKTIERPIFQREREHLANLRKDVLGK